MKQRDSIIKRYYKPEENAYIEAEPGDKTRYRFMLQFLDKFVRVAGTPDMRMYEYSYESINYFWETNGENATIDDNYIKYIAEHSFCNPWTALAFLKVMKEIIPEMEVEIDG